MIVARTTRPVPDTPSSRPIDIRVDSATRRTTEVVIVGAGGHGRELADIVRAICLGATAAMVGRAHFYALGAGGERGVDWMLDFMDHGVRQTMALIGESSIDGLDASYVRSRSGREPF